MTEFVEPESNSVSLYGDEGQFACNWIILGMVAGLVGDVAYFIAAAPFPLPFR